MLFRAQHGLHGVKSVLSTCFSEAKHGLDMCEFTLTRQTLAEHGLSKSVLSTFTDSTQGSVVNELQHGLAKSVC